MNNIELAYFGQRNKAAMAFEAFTITAIWLIILILMNRNDPLLLQGIFPWAVLAPIFCMLYYGTAYGYASLACVTAAVLFQTNHFLFSDASIRQMMAGMFTLILLTNFFISYWLRRVKQVEHLNFYTRSLLEDISKDYFLLKLSHERLEHRPTTQSMSFRQALYQLQQEARHEHQNISEAIGLRMLTIFSQYCLISQAALIVFNEDAPTHDRIVSILGPDFAIDLKDDLIQSSMKDKDIVYLSIQQLSTMNVSAYLAVIPLISNDSLKGLIVIKDMPLWSLTPENITALGVLSANMMMHLYPPKTLGALYQAFPMLNADLLKDLFYLRTLKQAFGMDSILSCLTLPDRPQQEQLIQSLFLQKRTLDHMQVIPRKTGKAVLIILPLTNAAEVQGYIRRMTDWLRNEFNWTLNQDGLIYEYRLLSAEDIQKQLTEIISI